MQLITIIMLVVMLSTFWGGFLYLIYKTFRKKRARHE